MEISALNETWTLESESGACTYLILGEAIIEVCIHHDSHDHNGKFRNAPSHDDCYRWKAILQ